MSWATATARAPDGGRLIDHHQHQALVDLSQLVLVVGQGPVEDPPPVPAQGRGPVLAPCRRPVPMKTSMSSISISPATSRCMGAGPAGGQAGPRTHACERPLPLCGGSFPLSAVTSARLPQATFTPRIINTDGDKTSCPQQPAQPPAPTTRDHQQGNGGRRAAH